MTGIKVQVLAGLTKRVEVIDTDYIETVHMLPIVEGVHVEIFAESGQAALHIGDQEFVFFFTDEMAKILNEWDTVEPLELFDALYRNRWQSKAEIASKVA